MTHTIMVVTQIDIRVVIIIGTIIIVTVAAPTAILTAIDTQAAALAIIVVRQLSLR